MPDLLRTDVQALTENGFEEGPGESLWGFEAREVGQDVWVGFFGVADPAGAGGGEDRRFRWAAGERVLR